MDSNSQLICKSIIGGVRLRSGCIVLSGTSAVTDGLIDGLLLLSLDVHWSPSVPPGSEPQEISRGCPRRRVAGGAIAKGARRNNVRPFATLSTDAASHFAGVAAAVGLRFLLPL